MSEYFKFNIHRTWTYKAYPPFSGEARVLLAITWFFAPLIMQILAKKE